MFKKFRIVLLTSFIVIFSMTYYLLNFNTVTEEYSINAKQMKEYKALGTTKVDRIYFFSTGNSDCILIESQGRYGLVDTSNRYEKTIVNKNGKTLDTSGHCLSSQTNMQNGKTIAQYLINKMGVNHLDFIIGTHGHSDHIGGVPGIANTKLVNSSTRYIYKEYGYITDSTNNNVWHNETFVYQAKKSIQAKNGVLVPLNVSNLNKSTIIKAGDSLNNYPSSGIIDRIKGNTQLKNVVYNKGNANNWYDDNIYFEFGNYQIRLYNLFTTPSSYDENVNSIVTTVQKGDLKATLLADINEQDGIEQKISQSIKKDIGTVNVLKLAHHGIAWYSNSKATADNLQPKICIGTNEGTSGNKFNLSSAIGDFQYYTQKKFGTKFYETGRAGRAIVVTFNTKNVTINELNTSDKLVSAANAASTKSPATEGWSYWANRTPKYKNSGMADNSSNYYWMYFNSNKSVATGWKYVNGRWYYFNNDGIMQTGWITYKGKRYYLSTSTSGCVKHGEMITGWKDMNGWYYFNNSGEMLKGWHKIYYNGKNYWFYFAENDNQYPGFKEGMMLTGRHQVKYNGKTLWYYFCESSGKPCGYTKGAMLSWITYKGHTYNGSGAETSKSLNNYTLTVNPNGGTWGGKTANSMVKQQPFTSKALNKPIPRKYRITFNGNGGSNPAAREVSDTFKNWTKSGLGTLNGSTYYFGEGNGAIKANYTNNKITLPTPTRSGYKFAGWYKEAKCINKVGQGGTVYTVKSSATLYAKWIANEYTLTVNPNGGTWNGIATNSEIKQKCDTTKNLESAIPPIGYNVVFYDNDGSIIDTITTTKTFIGWTKTSGSGSITGNVYKYGAGNGTVIANYEDDAIILPTPTRDGYVFEGWYQEPECLNKLADGGVTCKITKDITMYAKWIQGYQLKVDPNGGTYNGNTDVSVFIQNSGTQIELENPVAPQGFVVSFNGNGTENLEDIVSTKSFVEWKMTSGIGTIEGSTFTFDEGNATIEATYSDNSIVLPAIEREGYDFEGWYSNIENGELIGKAGDNYLPTENVTMYAKWIQRYELKVDLNGGTYNGNTDAFVFMQNSGTQIELENPVAPQGFVVSFNGNGTENLEDIVSMKSFVEWKMTSGVGTIEGSTFTFDEGNATIEATYSDNSIVLPSIEREGYEFEGWYNNIENGEFIGKAGDDYLPTENIILYAVWKANSDEVINSDPEQSSQNGIEKLEYGSTSNLMAFSKIDGYNNSSIGDVNGDGLSNIKDILMMNKYRLNKAESKDNTFTSGDVNKDGKIDIKDILVLNKFRLGKTEF